MLGAIIGDLAGSIYEYEQYHKVSPVEITNIIPANAFFSDDTILTVAIADAIINNIEYGVKLKEYTMKYFDKTPKDVPYFETMFSPNFFTWAKGNEQGCSCGNGAMMRISPVGYLFNTEREIIENVRLATSPSHNSDIAIECATTIALIIFYARQGFSKEEIVIKLNLKITKPNIKQFNYTCQDTIDLCLYAFFTANSFEECVRLAISFGGDTDTNACIVGSMAEAMYGINESLKQMALSKLPKEFIEIVQKFYEKIKIYK